MSGKQAKKLHRTALILAGPNPPSSTLMQRKDTGAAVYKRGSVQWLYKQLKHMRPHERNIR